MEVVESVFSGLFVESLMEFNDFLIGVTGVLPVEVDTINAEVHEAVDDGIYILVCAVAVLCSDDCAPCSTAHAAGVAGGIEELDTAVHVGTVAVCGVGPCGRSLEQTVVPRTEEACIVPYGEHIAIEELRRLSDCRTLTITHGEVHPQVALLVCVLHKACRTIENGFAANVRTEQCNVSLLNAGCSPFSVGWILAAIFCRFNKEVKNLLLVEAAEVISISSGVVGSKSLDTRHACQH